MIKKIVYVPKRLTYFSFLLNLKHTEVSTALPRARCFDGFMGKDNTDRRAGGGRFRFLFLLNFLPAPINHLPIVVKSPIRLKDDGLLNCAQVQSCTR